MKRRKVRNKQADRLVFKRTAGNPKMINLGRINFRGGTRL